MVIILTTCFSQTKPDLKLQRNPKQRYRSVGPKGTTLVALGITAGKISGQGKQIQLQQLILQ